MYCPSPLSLFAPLRSGLISNTQCENCSPPPPSLCLFFITFGPPLDNSLIEPRQQPRPKKAWPDLSSAGVHFCKLRRSTSPRVMPFSTYGAFACASPGATLSKARDWRLKITQTKIFARQKISHLAFCPGVHLSQLGSDGFEHSL